MIRMCLSGLFYSSVENKKYYYGVDKAKRFARILFRVYLMNPEGVLPHKKIDSSQL